jgi:hypothetical protein
MVEEKCPVCGSDNLNKYDDYGNIYYSCNDCNWCEKDQSDYYCQNCGTIPKDLYCEKCKDLCKNCCSCVE